MTLPRPLLLRLVLTSAVMWLIVRVAGGALGIVKMSPHEVAVIAGLVLALVWIDIRAFRERILLGNLALSPLRISAIILVTTLVLEAVLIVSIGSRIQGLRFF